MFMEEWPCFQEIKLKFIEREEYPDSNKRAMSQNNAKISFVLKDAQDSSNKA